MRILLDTHALLWALGAPDRLSDTARHLIAGRSTEILVSSASAWEIATKHRIGKLPDAGPLIDGLDGHLERLGTRELPIGMRHASLAGALRWDHRDPFDRMLAAQAILEDVALVSADSAFEGLPVLRVRW